MSQNNQQNEQNNQENNSGKIQKRFDNNMKRLAAVFNNAERKVLGKKNKVANADISTVVDELLKERREATAKEFKTQCGALLDKYIQFDKEMKEEEAKLKKIKEQKMEEFSKAIEATFGLVENIDSLAGQYAKILGEQTSAQPAIAAAMEENTNN